MQTDIDIDKLKQHLRRGCVLRNRGDGWQLEVSKDFVPTLREPSAGMLIPDPIVALLSAQGHIKTELRLVGSAQWVQS